MREGVGVGAAVVGVGTVPFVPAVGVLGGNPGVINPILGGVGLGKTVPRPGVAVRVPGVVVTVPFRAAAEVAAGLLDTGVGGGGTYGLGVGRAVANGGSVGKTAGRPTAVGRTVVAFVAAVVPVETVVAVATFVALAVCLVTDANPTIPSRYSHVAKSSNVTMLPTATFLKSLSSSNRFHTS